MASIASMRVPSGSVAVRLRLGRLARQAAVPAILVLALAIRAAYVLGEPFPLNDGGLFVAMAADIRAAGFGLPAFTSYNAGEIPFAYPPLALYLAAAWEALIPGGFEGAFRVLPLVGAVLLVWAFWRLAVALIPSQVAALAATLLFALAPRSFTWLLMGGGLPRAFGLAFALLAAREAWLLLDGDRPRLRTGLAGLFAALTLLTHLETAAFLGATLLAMGVCRPSRAWRTLPIVAAIAAVIAAPWWATVIARHGLDPFLSATDHGGRLMDNWHISWPWVWELVREPVFTGEPYFPVIAALGLLGGAWCVVRRQWFLALWFASTALLGFRAYMTFATVPTAMLAGVAVGMVILPALRGRGGAPAPSSVAAAACVAAGVVAMSVAGASSGRGEMTYLRGLPEADRDAMSWAAEELPANAKVLVVPAEGWYADMASEWFPALAERKSVATPQGYEWVSGDFAARTALHEALRGCANAGTRCLTDVAAGTDFSYVYVPAGCCERLQHAIRSSGTYEVLFDHGALIAERWRDD
jgi:hypothetical protein